MIDPVTMNARQPKDDEYGLAMLNRMNDRHRELHQWALGHVSIEGRTSLLDIGFGGGQNIYNLSHLAPSAHICGIDFSEASYKKCAELNKEAIDEGRVALELGSAEHLPYQSGTFQLATAFETVYYWPNIVQCFRNVHDVLAEGGEFLICNEDASLQGNEELADALNMTFYSLSELEALLHQAGFETVRTDTHPNGKWICTVAVR